MSKSSQVNPLSLRQNYWLGFYYNHFSQPYSDKQKTLIFRVLPLVWQVQWNSFNFSVICYQSCDQFLVLQCQLSKFINIFSYTKSLGGQENNPSSWKPNSIQKRSLYSKKGFFLRFGLGRVQGGKNELIKESYSPNICAGCVSWSTFLSSGWETVSHRH